LLQRPYNQTVLSIRPRGWLSLVEGGYTSGVVVVRGKV
jgi:hypothetical protein